MCWRHQPTSTRACRARSPRCARRANPNSSHAGYPADLAPWSERNDRASDSDTDTPATGRRLAHAAFALLLTAAALALLTLSPAALAVSPPAGAVVGLGASSSIGTSSYGGGNRASPDGALLLHR